jgi:peptidoglycan hydrolase CwlO-like protein
MLSKVDTKKAPDKATAHDGNTSSSKINSKVRHIDRTEVRIEDVNKKFKEKQRSLQS